MNATPIRIFISSPGDVDAERRRAALVVSRLRREFARFFDVQPVLWEYEVMLASAHFQDVIIEPKETEIFVCILWSRLGTELPERYNRGGRRTGTEWEFENALDGWTRAGQPDLLVYRKQNAEIRGRSAAEARAAIAQLEKLEAFWHRQFEHSTGGLERGFTSFTEIDTFEQKLESDLRKCLERRLEQAEAAGGEAMVLWHQGSPYRGLERFEFEHAPIFFGRTAARKHGIDQWARRAAQGTAFILILGMSGTGKSSLVRAGLIPDLVQPGVVPGVDAWRRAILRPREQPADLPLGLAEALSAAVPEIIAAGTDAASLATLLRQAAADRTASRSTPALMPGLKRAGELSGAWFGKQEAVVRIVLLVDQLEELFTLPEITSEARIELVEILADLAAGGTTWIVATMRSDFFQRISDVPRLAELAAGDGQLVLMPPDADELRELITRPAASAGLTFEQDADRGALDAVIWKAAQGRAGVLPLLQFALNELYRRDVGDGHRSQLTFASYDAIGTLEGSIASRAEEIREAMSPEEQQALDSCLLQLVTIREEDDTVTARSVPLDAAPAAVASSRDRVLGSLAEARLLVFSGDGTRPVADLAHEALITHWPHMRELIARQRRFLRLRTRIAREVIIWRDSQRATDRLLSDGPRLAEAKELRSQHEVDIGSELGGDLVAYIDASVSASDRRQHTAVVRQRLIALVVAAVVGLFIVAAGFISLARRETAAERTQSEQRRKVAEARRLSSSAQAALAPPREHDDTLSFGTDPTKRLRSATLDAAASVRLAPSVEGDRALRQALALIPASVAPLGPERGVAAVAYHASRGWLAATGDGKPTLWPLGDVAAPSAEPPAPGRVSISPDGRRVATISGRYVHIWDVDEECEVSVISDEKEISSVYLANGGPLLTVSGNWARPLSATGAESVLFPQRFLSKVVTGPAFVNGNGEIRAAAISSGGEFVALARDTSSWVLRPFEVTGSFDSIIDSFGEDLSLRVVALSSAAGCVAYAYQRSTQAGLHTVDGVRVQRVGTLIRNPPPQRFEAEYLDDEISALAFSSDGRWLGIGRSSSMQVVDLETESEVARLPVQNADAIVFHPKAHSVATVAGGTARVWDVRLDRHVSSTRADEIRSALISGVQHGEDEGDIEHAAVRVFVAISPDGRWAVARSSEGDSAALWDLVDGHKIADLGDVGAPVAFSSDSKRIAIAAGEDVVLSDASNGAEQGRLKHGETVERIGFGGDSQIVISGGAAAVRVWDLSAQPARSSSLEGARGALSISRDGHRLATRDQGGIAVWDSDSRAKLAIIPVAEEVKAASFNPDASALALLTEGGSVRIWRMADRRELSSHDHLEPPLAWSPDGKRLAARAEKAVKVWNVDSGAAVDVDIRARAPFSALAFSPTGEWIAAVEGGNALVWQVETGLLVADVFYEDWPWTVQFEPDGSVHAAAFKPDGEWIATGARAGTPTGWILWPDVLRAEACARLSRTAWGSQSDDQWKGACGV